MKVFYFLSFLLLTGCVYRMPVVDQPYVSYPVLEYRPLPLYHIPGTIYPGPYGPIPGSIYSRPFYRYW